MNNFPTIVITGGTSGIGLLTAITLAKQGAHLVLTARNKAKAAIALGAIKNASPGTSVDIHYADFTRLKEVAAVAVEIGARYARIDALVNNAGVHAFEQRVTDDGFAEMVSVNYFAPWLLTNILRDRLLQSAPSRIVTVSSEASRRSGGLVPSRDLIETGKFGSLGSSRVYGKTKLMDIMFSMELARQLKETGVTANCIDPGFNVTELGRELSFAAPLEKILNWLKIGNPQRGADMLTKFVSDPHFLEVSGGYFSVKDAKALIPIAPGADHEVQRELWQLTSDLLGDYW